MNGFTSAVTIDEIEQIKESVRNLCLDFPGEYWREKDRNNQYPTEFVTALTKSGFNLITLL